MLRSWRIGTAFGIPVYVHPTFLLAPLFVLMRNGGGGGLSGAVYLCAMVVAIFGCVILHEFGHALMARYFGIKTRDVTIYPIGGVARLEGMSEEPHEEILIAIAGPAVNVVIAVLLMPVVILGIVAGVLNPDPWQVSLGDGVWPLLAQFAYCLCGMNIALVVFNLIPAFPMDGGRVLRALLSMGLGLPRGTEIAARIGMVLAFCLGAAGLKFGNYMLPFLALFVALAGQQELLAVRYREKVRQAQRRMAVLTASNFPPFSGHEPSPVGRAVEEGLPLPEEPRRPAEPQLLFRFRAIEIPEPPR